MRAKSIAIACLLGLPLAVLFAPALVGDCSLVYRDAAHYYRPLYDRVAGEWGEGRLPLWNSWEDLGRPLAGDPTAAAFYPGKLLYCLPIDPARRYHLYIFAHAWLAACGAYCLARAWGVRCGGALLAGWSYSLGGAVLFQAVNVIFLVGAAWLPLAMLAADRALARRCYRWAVLLGAILALMVLGGDAQLAYTTGLMAVIYALILWRAGDAHAEESSEPSPALLRSRPLLLLASAASAAVLCAVQLGASYAWLPQTTREASAGPANVYQAATLAWDEENDSGRIEPFRSLVKRPPPGTPPEHLYDFSVGPWHWPELLWPGMSGCLFPENTRWSDVIPTETRTWVPSLYMGLLPLLLAVVATRWRRWNAATTAELHRCWLTWLAMAALLLALGRFGLGWLLEQLRLAGSGGAGEPVRLADPAGGPYWLLKLMVPGYASFRYPAKLFVYFSLAVSLLAGFGWQRLWVEESSRARRQLMWMLYGVAVLSVGIYGATYPLRGWWDGWMRTVPADDLFGPLEAAAALGELRWALVHALVVAGVAAAFLWRVGKMSPSLAGGLLLTLCVAELTVAQRPLLEFAPSELWREPAAFAELIAAAEAEDRDDTSAVLPPRVYRAGPWGWRPDVWAEGGSPNRPAEGLAWDRGTLLPKYAMGEGIAVVAPGGSFSDARLEDLLEAARRHGHAWGQGHWEPGLSLYEVLGVEYLAVPEDLELPGMAEAGTRLDSGEHAAAALWSLEPAAPRAWISHDWEVVQLAEHPQERLKQLESRYFQLGTPQWHTVARLEESPHEQVWSDLTVPVSEASDLVEYAPGRVVLQADLTEPGILVLTEQHSPGWQLAVSSRARYGEEAEIQVWQAPLLRVHGVLCGVWLPAGEHMIEMQYEPICFWRGFYISLAGWLALLGLLLWPVLLRLRPAESATKDSPKSSA